jgi:ADP-ribose pyrophosphatase YjhB (NUDIX family)
MNFCSDCGAAVAYRVPDGDNLPRAVCTQCASIHYENPRIIVGCIPESHGRILLCRRAIEPRIGLWTVPAGFMENGETTEQGARRETLEEANARVDDLVFFSLYNLPHVNQIYLLFRATLCDDHFSPGSETLETVLFAESEIPWDEIAFATVRNTLRNYFSDRQRGMFGFHVGTVEPMSSRQTSA